MEAPEKIYLIRNFTTSTSLNTTNDYRGKYLQEWYKSREKDADVEYIRTDAFIEKALKFLDENFFFNNVHHSIESGVFESDEEMFDYFINYVKGE